MKKLLLAIVFFPYLAFAQPGGYIQGQIGGVYLINGTTVSVEGPTGFAGRGSFGYLWGEDSLNYGLEAGFAYFPHATLDETFLFVDNKLDYSGSTTDILGVLKYNFANKFNLFGKIGVAYLSQQVTSTSSVLNFSAQHTSSGTKVGPEIALGVGYQFNPHWEMSLTQSTVLVPTDITQNNPVATTVMTLLGLTYHF